MSLTIPVDDTDGVMLGVLAVPSWMTPSDFLAFVAPAVEGIGHLRIIRYVDIENPVLYAETGLILATLHLIAQWS